MKPSQLAQILIRLSAISLFLQAINQTIYTVGVFAMNSRQMPDPLMLISAVISIVLSVGLWLLAPAIGGLISSRGMDQEGVVSAITFQQLLNAMFIGIGLYFSLSSIGALINSLHFFLVMRASPEIIPAGMNLSPYELSKSAINFAAGVLLIVSAPHWSRRLSNTESRTGSCS